MIEMQHALKSGQRLSLLLDECSSLRHKGYHNINAHQDKDKYWNLKIVAISGRLIAEKTAEEVENKLSEFSLSLSRLIVAVVTDVVNAMVIWGRCLDCEHQLCYANSIHLAVCDVLCKKQTLHETDATESESSAETDADELEEDDCHETEELWSGINIEHGQNEEQAASHIRSDLVSNAVNVATAIDIIRKSPVKSYAQQSHVKSEKSKSIRLLLDCKTRWNCLVAMLERILDLRSPVKKQTLIDYKIHNPLNEAEYVAHVAIVRALKPIQFGSDKLFRWDVTFHGAEGVISFIIEEPHDLQWIPLSWRLN